MARLTIERSIFGKITTQMRKPQNAHLIPLMKEVKITENEKHDSILWDPSPQLIDAVIALLINERDYIRKKDSSSFTKMQDNLGRCERFKAANFTNQEITP